MFIAGRAQMVSNMKYSDAIKFFLDMGFKGVELNNVDIDFNLRDDFFKKSEILAIKEALKDSRVQGFSVGSHMDYVNESAKFDAVIASMDIANQLGTNIVIINGCQIDENVNLWNKMVDKTGLLCREAEKRGVLLCEEFEPNFVCGSSEQMLRLFDEVGSHALAANMDLGHVFLCDKEPLNMIRRVGGRIAHCHIENMGTGVHSHKPLYEGDMDIPSYIDTLKEIGYAGQLSFDYYHEDYVKVAPRVIDYFNSMV